MNCEPGETAVKMKMVKMAPPAMMN